MTVLNEAEAIYLGERRVEAVYLGETLIWSRLTVPYRDAVLASGPTAYYRMHELDGDIADAMGGAPGVVSGGLLQRAQPSLLPSGEGRSFRFGDGQTAAANGMTTARITVPDTPGTRLGDTSFSIELWAQWDQVAMLGLGNKAIISSPDGFLGLIYGSIAAGAWFTLTFQREGASASLMFPAGGHLLPDAVYHVVVTRSAPTGGVLRLYINGACVVQSTGGGIGDGANTNGLLIGWRIGDFYSFLGYLQEVALYNKPLPALEAHRHWLAGNGETTTYLDAILADQPVIYNRLSDWTSAILTDLVSPTQANGSIVEPTLRVQPSILPSGEGQSMGFAGDGGPTATAGGRAISVPLSPFFNATQGLPFTVEMWIRLDRLPNVDDPYGIISQTTTNSLCVLVDSAGMVRWYGAVNGTLLVREALQPISANTPIYIAVTSDGGNPGINRLYLNGLEQTGGGAARPFLFNTIPVQLGTVYRAPGTQYPFYGRVQELAIYDRELTPQQIAAHYQAGGGVI